MSRQKMIAPPRPREPVTCKRCRPPRRQAAKFGGSFSSGMTFHFKELAGSPGTLRRRKLPRVVRCRRRTHCGDPLIGLSYARHDAGAEGLVGKRACPSFRGESQFAEIDGVFHAIQVDTHECKRQRKRSCKRYHLIELSGLDERACG